jgi:type IV pilus assembly protein PilO
MIAGLLNDLRDRPTLQKFGLLTFVIAIVFVLDWQWVYGPRAETLGEVQATLAQRRSELDQKQTKTNTRDTAERELRDLQSELRRAEARLPDQREIADLLSSIAANARGVGLDITLFRQRPETYADFYAEVPVEMKMRGSYHDVASFFDRVKRLDRIVNVADMRLEKPTVKGDRIVLDASVTATTFRFLNEAERARLSDDKKTEKDKPGAKGKSNARSGA